MDLYSKILNIKGQNSRQSIVDAIKETKEKLKGLDYERMCLVYNSYLYETLLKKHIIVHIVDTKDFNASFEHRFLITYDGNDYYLCDLTYSQFKDREHLKELLETGFMKCNDMVLQKYLQIVLKENKNLCIEQVFNSNNSFRR